MNFPLDLSIFLLVQNEKRQGEHASHFSRFKSMLQLLFELNNVAKDQFINKCFFANEM